MKGNKITKRLKAYFDILVKAGIGFVDDKAPKFSGALAYTTIFSLPPMLLLIIIVGGTFYEEKAITGQLFGELREFIGTDTALQVQDVMSKINFHQNSTIATIISIIILVVGATGVFVEIQDSLNMIWGVRAKAKKGFIKILLSRLLSFTMIIGFGFLLLVSLMLNAIILSFSGFIIEKLPFIPVDLIGYVNTIVTFLVLLVLFMVIFKMLPDVKIKWRQVLPGAIVTTLLFFVGKYLIGLYISGNTMATLYGAAGSVIVLLLWIYFSSFILYFGAEFTKAYIEHFGGRIEPNSFAEYTEKILLKEYLERDEINKKLAEQKEDQSIKENE